MVGQESYFTIFKEEAISAWAGFHVDPIFWSNWNLEIDGFLIIYLFIYFIDMTKYIYSQRNFTERKVYYCLLLLLILLRYYTCRYLHISNNQKNRTYLLYQDIRYNIYIFLFLFLLMYGLCSRYMAFYQPSDYKRFFFAISIFHLILYSEDDTSS